MGGHHPGLHKEANRAEVRSKLALCNPQDTGSLGPVRDPESGGLEIDATSISPTPLRVTDLGWSYRKESSALGGSFRTYNPKCATLA